MERNLGDINEKLDMLLSRGNARCTCATAGNSSVPDEDRRIDSLDRKINMIAEAVGVRVRAKEEEDAEDRKRLKERLKEAMAMEKTHRLRGVDQDEKEGWVEYIFGITQANGRVGKMGSRCTLIARRHSRRSQADGRALRVAQAHPPAVALHARSVRTRRRAAPGIMRT